MLIRKWRFQKGKSLWTYTNDRRQRLLFRSTLADGPAIVNLGTICGDVQQVIGNVSETGHADLADVLRRLADAINTTEELGEERAAYLEQVRFIATEATSPAADRQVSVVRAVLLALRTSLQDTANVAAVLGVAGPLIAKYFGFHWPL